MEGEREDELSCSLLAASSLVLESGHGHVGWGFVIPLLVVGIDHGDSDQGRGGLGL